MNPVLGIKDPKNPKSALTGNKGTFRDSGGDYIPTSIPRRSPSTTLRRARMAFRFPRAAIRRISTRPLSIRGSAISSGRSLQKRLDLSIRKGFKITEKIRAQYELNVFNVTNTTSLDIPQDQAQIRQNNGCSTTAITAYGGGNNCNQYRSYLGYGEVVTSNDPADQQSALANLDQVPFSNGTGKATQLPLNASTRPRVLAHSQS